MTVSLKDSKHSKIQSVAIIGGGASGAVALDTLIKQRVFSKITVFERRNILGGIWNLDEHPDKLTVPPGSEPDELDPPLPVPSFENVDPDENGQKIIKKPSPKKQNYHHTPSYEGMRTNIPEKLMAYSDVPRWPYLDHPERDPFTTIDAVHQYIDTYLNRHPEHIQKRTTVEKLTKIDEKYELILRTQTNEKDKDGNLLDKWWKDTFDAIIVATGHYHVPQIPDVPGIKEVYKVFPEKIQHAKTFRSAEGYKDQTVVVVGSRASGADITRLVSKFAKEVYQSTRSHYTSQRTVLQDNVYEEGVITKYELYEDKSGFRIHFTGGDTLENPDVIIYGTGYFFSYPFLREQYPDFTDGTILPETFQHTFYTPDPKITTIGVPTDGISFRCFEYQAVLVARYYAGEIALPSDEEQRKWRDNRLKDHGSTRSYHTVGFEGAEQYFKELTALGGGAGPLTPGARGFPVFTEADRKIWLDARVRLLKFWDA